MECDCTFFDYSGRSLINVVLYTNEGPFCMYHLKLPNEPYILPLHNSIQILVCGHKKIIMKEFHLLEMFTNLWRPSLFFLCCFCQKQ